MYLDDGDDVMVLLVLGAAFFGCIYLVGWLIYREIDFARANTRVLREAREEATRRKEDEAHREHQAFLERRDTLADLRDHGICEYELERLSPDEIATRLRAAMDLHRRVIEGFTGALRQQHL